MDDIRFYALFNAMVKCYKKKLFERSLFDNRNAHNERETFFRIINLRKHCIINAALNVEHAIDLKEHFRIVEEKSISKDVKLLSDYATFLYNNKEIDQETLLKLNSSMSKFILFQLKSENDS